MIKDFALEKNADTLRILTKKTAFYSIGTRMY